MLPAYACIRVHTRTPTPPHKKGPKSTKERLIFFCDSVTGGVTGGVTGVTGVIATA